jgi:tyrosyl-DNA phosphodiesterase 2
MSKSFYISIFILILSLVIYYISITPKASIEKESPLNETTEKLSNIPALKFDGKKWQKIIPRNSNVNIDSLSFITYNIWFDRHNWTNRTTAQISLFKKHNPDIICLQEVTMNLYNTLQNDTFIQSNYIISGYLQQGYDVMILSKHEAAFTELKFISRMQRRLLIADLLVNGSYIRIATSHFESLHESHAYRKDQLNMAFSVLTSKSSFLLGDFNFDNEFNKGESDNLDRSFFDSWTIWKDRHGLNTSDGVTYPAMDGEPAHRLDRVMFNDERFELDKFEIIGKGAIETTVDHKHTYGYIDTPSDHYGLYVKFLIKK